jgi:hypothetical protein
MLKHYLQKHGYLWNNRAYLKSVFFGLFVLAIGLAVSAIAMEHLKHALHAQWGPDIFLDNLPVLKLKDVLGWGMELLLIGLIPLLLLYPEYMPFSLKTIGLLYAIRSFFIVLTPLGNRPDQVVETSGFFYRIAYSSNDFFFSGHVAFPFMLALIFWEVKPIRFLMLVVAVFFAAAVLLAHTHYSIDVFSVPFIVPTIFGLSRYLFPHDVRYTRVQYSGPHAEHIPPIL